MQTRMATAALTNRKRALGAVARRRSTEKTAIRIAPTATADARHELLMPSPGCADDRLVDCVFDRWIDDEEDKGRDDEQDRGLDLLARGRRRVADEGRQTHVRVAAHGEDGPEDREPDEQRRGQLVAPHQRAMQEVAGDHADEEKSDLEQQDRGCDQRNGKPESLFSSSDP